MINEVISRALVAGTVLGLALAAVPTMAAVSVNDRQGEQQVRVEAADKVWQKWPTFCGRPRCFFVKRP
jgi:hypothetical protein